MTSWLAVSGLTEPGGWGWLAPVLVIAGATALACGLLVLLGGPDRGGWDD